MARSWTRRRAASASGSCDERLSRTETADDLVRTLGDAQLPGVVHLPGPLGIPSRTLVGQAMRLLVLGGITPSARKKLGEPWTPVHEAALTNVMRLVRPLYAQLPERLRYCPLAYHPRGRARELEKIRGRSLKAAPPARA